MSNTTTFILKTKRGGVRKVVREHYLRDDIFCGFGSNCTNCSEVVVPLPRQQVTAQLSAENEMILIPDTNIVYHQIDLMEHGKVGNVVILQTVLQELRHKSISIFQRLRNRIADPKARFYVFCNEHHRETYVKREVGESPNDRNDRAIRRAVDWYRAHVSSFAPSATVALITDDRENRKKATDEGLLALSARQYVEKRAVDAPELVDLVAASQLDADNADPAVSFSYPEHLSATQVSAGLKSAAFFQGVLGISTHNFLEGSVIIKNNQQQEQTIQIIGREHLNRGVQGDVVAIQILPKSEWKTNVSAIVEEEESAASADSATGVVLEDDIMDVDGAKASPSSDALPTGKVVAIIKRNWRPFCGTIEAASVQATSSLSAIQSVFFWSMDKRIPKIRIRTRQAHELVGKRIIVSIDSWDKSSRYPSGHFVRVLGEVGDKATETQVLLLEHDVPFAPFSPSVLSFLPQEGDNWIVTDVDLPNRRDFRELDVCSIDPPGCTDIDDALHARRLDNGNFEVGVHIADVSHFVKPENAMDLEARRRGTSVYLVDKRIDMLPSLLGTNLCSLRSNVDRLAFSCIWEMTPDAQVVSCSYSKSIIRSKNSFTYDEAQARLDDPKMNDPISLGIKALNTLAKKLRKKRMDGGALTLASPEVRFKLESGSDSQDPVDVELKELKDTNALVEEFMLLANIYVAKKIHSVFPESSMLRRHPKPPANNFETLIKALEPFNIKIDPSTSRTLSDSLDRAVVPSDPYFNKLMRIMTTRCMMQAVYFCSGTIAEQEFWHYGLACPIYTHFTSPIRRYSDLQVHRLLSACIGYDETYASDLTDKIKVKEMSDVLNYRHRMAQQASRASVELYTHLFFKGKVLTEEAYVIRVLVNGLVVLVPKYGVEGVVYTSPDPKDPPLLTLDPDANRLVSPDGQVSISLFQKVKVQISVTEAGDAAAQRSKLQLRLVEPRVQGMNEDESAPLDQVQAGGQRNKKQRRK